MRGREQIGDSLPIPDAPDRNAEQGANRLGKGGIALHVNEHRATDDDLTPRVLFSGRGFLGGFELDESMSELFPLGLQSRDTISNSFSHRSRAKDEMQTPENSAT